MPRTRQTNDMRALHHLIEAYHELCPTTYDKDQIDKTLIEMANDKVSPRKMVTTVVEMMLTGLRFGNWPSVMSHVNERKAARPRVPKRKLPRPPRIRHTDDDDDKSSE